jgi:hypothetical protein
VLNRLKKVSLSFWVSLAVFCIAAFFMRDQSGEWSGVDVGLLMAGLLVFSRNFIRSISNNKEE